MTEFAVEIDAAHIAAGVEDGFERGRVVVIDEPLQRFDLTLVQNGFPVSEFQQLEHEVSPAARDSIKKHLPFHWNYYLRTVSNSNEPSRTSWASSLKGPRSPTDKPGSE